MTSNVTPILWRIDSGTLAVTMHELALDTDNDKDVGFVALAYSAEHAAFFAYSQDQRSVWRIDRQLTHATKVSDVDLSRVRSRRMPSVRGACAEFGSRLTQFAGVAG